MARFGAVLGCVCMLLIFVVPSAGSALPSDDEIKQQIIAESIASYPGNCPCPYNLARNGSQCGGRSAYSRPGGYAPICYPDDVTDRMVKDYRHQHGLTD
jgi:hypothetical protein